MVQIQIGANRFISSSILNFNALFSTKTDDRETDSFVIHYRFGGEVLVHGTGFKYDAHGVLIGGFVKGFTDIDGYGRRASFEDMMLSVANARDAADTPNLADDLVLMKRQLSNHDTFSGGRHGDTFNSFNGDDVLYGNGGFDRLRGGDGSDRLIGGAEDDILSGGTGADTFLFEMATESMQKKGDRIVDFSIAESDRLDLKSIDANGNATGFGLFEFIGTEEFSEERGQLRYEFHNEATRVFADINGDGEADMVITLKDNIELSRDEFAI